MKKNTAWILIVMVVSVVLLVSMLFSVKGVPLIPAAQTPLATVFVTPRATLTPDPCAAPALFTEIIRVHKLTQQFESAALILTSNTLSAQSVVYIEELQRIRRAAEDQNLPACLSDLQTYQVAHMNMRIQIFNTALAFFNQYGNAGDQKTLDEILTPLYLQAEESARQYENEYYRLQGMTPTPAP